MDTSITIPIGTAIAVLISVWGFMMKFRKEVLEEVDKSFGGKIAQHQNECLRSIHETLAEIQKAVTRVETKLEYINGRDKGKQG